MNIIDVTIAFHTATTENRLSIGCVEQCVAIQRCGGVF